MTPSIRKAVLGMLAGAAASAPLALSVGHAGSSVVLAAVIGMIYAVSMTRMPHAYVDNLMAAAALGFWGGYATLARRVRRKFGGLKVY